MSLATAIRDAVGLAAQEVDEVLEEVQWFPWVEDDANDNGRPVYADAPILLRGAVEREPGVINLSSGEVIEYSHHIAFMGPVAAQGATGRKEPIDPRDKFVLADGTTSPTARVKPALFDSTTLAGFAFEVWLGVKR